jgi:hypothetical protein
MRTAENPCEFALSTAAGARLRVLARDHREGRLSLETYRKLRSPLLDGLGSGRATDSQRGTPPDTPTRRRNSSDAPVLMSGHPAAASRQHGRSYRWLRTVAMAAAGGLLVVAVLLMLACAITNTWTAPFAKSRALPFNQTDR